MARWSFNTKTHSGFKRSWSCREAFMQEDSLSWLCAVKNIYTVQPQHSWSTYYTCIINRYCTSMGLVVLKPLSVFCFKMTVTNFFMCYFSYFICVYLHHFIVRMLKKEENISQKVTFSLLSWKPTLSQMALKTTFVSQYECWNPGVLFLTISHPFYFKRDCIVDSNSKGITLFGKV